MEEIPGGQTTGDPVVAWAVKNLTLLLPAAFFVLLACRVLVFGGLSQNTALTILTEQGIGSVIAGTLVGQIDPVLLFANLLVFTWMVRHAWTKQQDIEGLYILQLALLLLALALASRWVAVTVILVVVLVFLNMCLISHTTRKIGRRVDAMADNADEINTGLAELVLLDAQRETLRLVNQSMRKELPGSTEHDDNGEIREGGDQRNDRLAILQAAADLPTELRREAARLRAASPFRPYIRPDDTLLDRATLDYRESEIKSFGSLGIGEIDDKNPGRSVERAILAALCFMVCAVFIAAGSWMPSEVIVSSDGATTVGYVLSSTDGLITVLTRHHQIVRIRSSSIESRMNCSLTDRDDSSSRLLPIFEAAHPAPSCPSGG